MAMQITVISGTNRPSNLSLQVAHLCKGILEAEQQQVQLLDLTDLPRDLAFAYLSSDSHPGFQDIQALVDQTSHFVFVVPEYNGSIPGILKLFIDACSYPDSFRGKSAVLVGIAAGNGGNEKGLGHLDDILTYFGMQVHPERLAIPKIRQRLLPDGKFADAEAKDNLEELLGGYLRQLTIDN
jgi:chromate reductase, NAD(P)H dehydrogenase (quinone)